MALTGVLRPGHVALRVLDMDAAVNHYGNVLGLIETGRDAQGRVYFKAWDEHDHHSVVLRTADRPGMDYMGWRVDSVATLKKLAQDVEASGLATDMKWIAAGEQLHCGERFRFTVPTGHVMELFAEKDKVGNGMPYVNPDPWPDGLKGMAPTRFDHCLVYGDDLDGSVKLFREVLGFTLAEQVMAGELMIGAFLTCSNKAHDIAFIRHGEKGKFHHCSFILDGWSDVLRAADIISKKDVSLDIGPTRHGITRGETIYFFDPSGNRNEVFSGGYISYPDKPTITWKAEDIGKAIFYHDRKLNEAFLNVIT
ncbi:MAG TPA: catechol 2,3-dioxygenase [Rhodocyclaceae bacterium]|nr:catechol 2,3-dioxygenase [Rhodocyclaceae bacterium]HMV54461.1 catechol 2,3-dioxygenase [Rhodocyclaceae bacterium]HNA05082.1 catechol 2,3-dioxygenase [Rhodocyclaceae bacterium]HNB80269.1 catechol 2,3-dioxygenase [Rhodocyclaceae bacterium]HNC62846.1 catechol 2,3-dioxygenase [Rhodocyclaceae bacterium]